MSFLGHAGHQRKGSSRRQLRRQLEQLAVRSTRRQQLLPAAAHCIVYEYFDTQDAEPEFFNICKEPKNLFQGITPPAYVAWRAGTTIQSYSVVLR
jgi:hypothetical protein